MGEDRKLGTLPRLGELVDRYRVVAEIAHGGMAAVYAVTRADAPGFDKLLAMKVMLPHLASDERFVAMFTDESRIAARINHPNVAQVFDVGQKPFPHLVLELVHGKSLAALLERAWAGPSPVLSRALICHVLAEIATGLHAAHEARSVDGDPLGIVHRDVSPQNVLIGYDGQVKVVDFGVAAARGRIASTRTGEVKGKMAFMAPEQLTRRQLDRRTDLWSFGVMAWQIFARRELFRGASESETMWNVINRAVPDIEDIEPSTPPALAEIIHACLQREAHRRPSNAADVAKAFREVAAAEMSGKEERTLAALMAEVFEAERESSRHRLSEAIRAYDQGPPVPESTTPTGLDLERPEFSADEVAPRATSARSTWLGAAVVLALLAAGGLAYSLVGSEEDPPTEQPMTAMAAPPPSEPGRDAAADGALVTVRIDPAVETVLVDDVPHLERPVRAPAGSTITLVGTDRVSRHPVDPADEGALLSLADVQEAPEPTAPIPTMAAAPRMTMVRRPAKMGPDMEPANTDMTPTDWMPLE